MKRSLFIIVLLLLSLGSYADSPPCWCSFKKESANKRYLAIVARPVEDSLTDPWKSIWTLSVYEKTGKSNKFLWKVEYDYTGYNGGILSDDGQTFTYINFWYREKTPLVDIYRQGKKISTDSLQGKNFRIPRYKLVQTVSHHVWLNMEADAYSYYKDLRGRLLVRVLTINGKVHYIDIVDGKFTSID